MKWTILLCLASLLCGSTLGNTACGQTLAATGIAPSHQLVVLLDEIGEPEWVPEAVVASVEGDNPSDPMRVRLQNPLHADFMITKLRTPAWERMHRPREDSLAQLERYVVLSYPSEEEASHAMAALKLDPAISAVTRNVGMQAFVQPADPEFAVVAGAAVDHYQWGYHSLPQGAGVASMNFPAAWDKVRGTAYLGHIDFGLQVNHPDLSGSFRPHFALNLPANNSSVDELVGQPYPIPNTNPQAYRPIYAGHGTHVAGIMAANTRHPSLPAGAANYPAVGVTGVCWWCSLITVKVRLDPGGDVPLTDYINAATWAIRRGAQVLNFSFGFNAGQYVLDYDCQPNFASNVEQPFCAFARLAEYLDVTVLAATGNIQEPHVAHPSSVPNIMSVGATQDTPNGGGNYRWATAGKAGSNYGPEMVGEGVVAPGFNILSTAYTDRNWSPGQSCGDSYGNGPVLSDGYGICTGTSMATPFVSGIAGLIKTVNPLQTAAQVRTRMLNAGTLHNVPSNDFGHGFVDANLAVTSAISDMQYRLTPLFAMSSANQKDYFYTVVPQHVRAAYLGTLSPQVTGNGVPDFYGYTFVGTNVAPGGTTYTIGVQPPATRITPKAQAWVFSTHVDPRNAGWELAPIWRMSYKCGDPVPSGRPNICAAFPYHVDHFYTTDVSELITFKNNHGYRPDGIEGYVYPLAGGQPAGTTPLVRAFKAADDDYAIFPQTQQASMTALGYTGSVTTLGYVYANTTGARPTY